LVDDQVRASGDAYLVGRHTPRKSRAKKNPADKLPHGGPAVPEGKWSNWLTMQAGERDRRDFNGFIMLRQHIRFNS